MGYRSERDKPFDPFHGSKSAHRTVVTGNTDSSSDTWEFDNRVAETAARDVSGMLRGFPYPCRGAKRGCPRSGDGYLQELQ